jgi:predicted NBD/HSP70 family sugar kinase
MLLFNGEEATQLISQSSLYLLEQALNQRGERGSQLFKNTDSWHCDEQTLQTWIEASAHGLAQASQNAMSLLDLDGVIIEGAMPSTVKLQLIEKTQSVLSTLDSRGLSPIIVCAGKVGPKAQSIGSANLPLLANYAKRA